MKPIFLGGRQITSKQTNMSATDKYYGGKKKQVRKYTERQAVLLWIFRDDFIKERQAPAWYWRKQAMCRVRKESRSRQSHRQVQRARQGPADPRAQAAAQGARGGGGGGVVRNQTGARVSGFIRRVAGRQGYRCGVRLW